MTCHLDPRDSQAQSKRRLWNCSVVSTHVSHTLLSLEMRFQGFSPGEGSVYTKMLSAVSFPKTMNRKQLKCPTMKNLFIKFAVI